MERHEWKHAGSVVKETAAPPPHILLAGSKIRPVFGESRGKETQQPTCCCRRWEEKEEEEEEEEEEGGGVLTD